MSKPQGPGPFRRPMSSVVEPQGQTAALRRVNIVRPVVSPAVPGKTQQISYTLGNEPSGWSKRANAPNDAPMFVKVFFSSFWKSARSWLADCGHDRDGPLAVEGRLLSGHEVSRLERVPRWPGDPQKASTWVRQPNRGPGRPGSCGVQPLAVVIAVATSVMVRVSRLPRTVRRWTGMAGSPRLAAIRRMACSEEAQGSSPPSRACRAASQLMAASGWPVLMLGAGGDGAAEGVAVQEVPVADDQPGGGDVGGNAVGGVQELAGQLLDAGGGGVHGDASRGNGPPRGRPAAGPRGGAGSYQVTRPAGWRGSRGGLEIHRRPARGCGSRIAGLSCSGKRRCQAPVRRRWEHWTRDVALQAADDLLLRQALFGAPLDVGAGGRVARAGAQPGDHDPPQRVVGLAVTAAVEFVPADLARRCRDRGDTAQVRPRALAAQPLSDGRRRRSAAARRCPGRRRARRSRPGARAVTSGPISSSRRSSWASRNWARRPSSRSATRVA